ncbi:MAG: translation elongation factor-like protein [Candidatus Aenigmarchaeota archaeon]|nr:translation elongation factor-like protein [Candidatus Aenigmarchaeota archaeon]
MAEKKLVGKITHFFDKIDVGVVELSANLKQGDMISVEGTTTNFTQTVDSMQVEHERIDEAKKGQSVGMKMLEKVRPGDHVFRLSE